MIYTVYAVAVVGLHIEEHGSIIMNNFEETDWSTVTTELIDTYYDPPAPYCRKCMEDILIGGIVTINTYGLTDGGFVCESCSTTILKEILKKVPAHLLPK